MSQSLNRLEARIQRLIEEGTARLFASQDTRGFLASRLIEAMQADVTIGANDEVFAPCIYTIYSNSDHAPALKANQGLMKELTTVLQRAAQESGFHITGEIVLHVAPEDELHPGEFRVRSAGAGEALTATQSLKAIPDPIFPQIPPGAFLIVGGTDIFPLKLPIVNIGRKSDNHLIIDDAKVSRRHAQLRAISGHYNFFDLGSTGGSKVNGSEVRSAALLAGDVINLAGVPLIYGQDARESSAETQEYRPGSNGSTPNP